MRDLELATLGVIAGRQPCTAYAVRRQFLDSPSTAWSGSAGAIYPLIGRLTEAGLVQARRRAGDRRGGTLLRLTAAGRSRLRRWLTDPPPGGAVIPVDPVRLRLGFLGALSARDRAKALDVLEAALEEEISAARRRARASAGREDELQDLAVLWALLAQRRVVRRARTSS